MSKTEFLQGLKEELEGKVPHSVIQENLQYYDTYITEEVSGGADENAVIDGLGGPRIIARTIVDAVFNTEDRPDGFDTMGEGVYGREGAGKQSKGQGRPDRERSQNQNLRYVDFSKWYVRLIAGMVVFCVICLAMTIFFGIIGLAGWILSYLWPVLLVLLLIWMFGGSR